MEESRERRLKEVPVTKGQGETVSYFRLSLKEKGARFNREGNALLGIDT